MKIVSKRHPNRKVAAVQRSEQHVMTKWTTSGNGDFTFEMWIKLPVKKEKK